MNDITSRIILSGVTGAIRTAVLSAGGAIVSGAAITTVTVPNTILWGLITVGTSTTTVIAAPVVTAFAISGALIGGLGACLHTLQKHKQAEERIRAYLN